MAAWMPQTIASVAKNQCESACRSFQASTRCAELSKDLNFGMLSRFPKIFRICVKDQGRTSI